MDLPADSHVHSEWSWDTGGPRSQAAGTMEATCRQATRIGLLALVFTEHLDLEDAWRADAADLMPVQLDRRPPTPMSQAVVSRLFPHAPSGGATDVLLWCTGRAAMSEHRRRGEWLLSQAAVAPQDGPGA